MKTFNVSLSRSCIVTFNAKNRGEACRLSEFYLGGNYYFTSDEVELHGKEIHRINAKHTKEDKLPSLGNIKDGLLKMILFTNLEDVEADNQNFIPVPTLKLTTMDNFNLQDTNKSQKEMLEVLRKESKINGFNIMINKERL